MARRTTLVRLLDMLRAEMRVSLNPAHNSQVRDAHINTLQRVQEVLWDEFNWPHLRVERFITLQAGQRYYDPPGDLHIDRIEKMELKYGGDWLKLCAGIETVQYSVWDSDEGERSWPVERWRISEDEQIEVWPIPADDGNASETDREGQIKVTAFRKLNPLVADSDRADLDDRLIVLYAAGELLGGSGAKDAELKLRQAVARKMTLQGNLMPRKQFKLFGQAQCVGKQLVGPPRIHYRDRETS